MHFATVDTFLKVVCHQEYSFARVRDYINIDIDRRKRIASFSGEGRFGLIEIGWIKSLFGVLRNGGVNLIITDIDLFD